MTPEQVEPRMTDEERTYIVFRVVLLAIGLMLFALGSIPTQVPLQRELALWALLLSTLATVFIVVAALRGRSRVARSMLWVLPVDLIAVAIFSGLMAREDAFYPVCVLVAIAYAMTVSYREALVAIVATALAYLFGHAILPFNGGVMGPVLLGLKTISIALVGIVTADLVAKRRQRELEAERAIAERGVVNEQLARRIADLQAVSRITEIIHSSLDFEEVGPLVLEILANVISIEMLCVFVIDKVHSETLFSASVGMEHDAEDPAPRLAVGDVESHFTCLRVFDHGSIMVLFCATAEDLATLSEDDRLVVGAVASELAVAVENSRLYKLTKRLAVTDELTGLSNYRHLQQRLDDEVSRANRYGKHLSLIMIDADEFKDFNDRFGHIAGDVALSEFGGALSAVVREVDMVARYGGEEFAIVLPETDAAGAFVTAEKIREAIESYLFADDEGHRCCTLTVSVGIATLPTHARDKESLLQQSDDALYRAKTGGKNRVCTPLRALEPETTTGDTP